MGFFFIDVGILDFVISLFSFLSHPNVCLPNTAGYILFYICALILDLPNCRFKVLFKFGWESITHLRLYKAAVFDPVWPRWAVQSVQLFPQSTITPHSTCDSKVVDCTRSSTVTLFFRYDCWLRQWSVKYTKKKWKWNKSARYHTFMFKINTPYHLLCSLVWSSGITVHVLQKECEVASCKLSTPLDCHCISEYF